jgi:GR25 family glycosyltransferase involved in LPS biosynthesis
MFYVIEVSLYLFNEIYINILGVDKKMSGLLNGEKKCIQYYLIHGVDASRKPKMEQEFATWGLKYQTVKWMNHPNKNEITPELYQSIVNQNESWCCGVYVPPNTMRLGVVSCTYKHYMALKDIAEGDADYGVIMEDSLHFSGDIPFRMEQYISELDLYYPGWDVIFDSAWKAYCEGPTQPDRLVYPKSNEINEHGHGGTRCAHLYLVTKACAKKLSDNFLPFNQAPDWYMNDLFRKLNIKVYWGEPSIAHVTPHESTAN